MKPPACLTIVHLIALSVVFISCERRKTINIVCNRMVVTDSAREVKDKIKIMFHEINATTIAYDSRQALWYANRYSPLNENSCGIYNNNAHQDLSDCAHFISHCLKNGGIEIKSEQPDIPVCNDGLCYRVSELEIALYALSLRYTNVATINIDKAVTGDYAFMTKPAHVFMICQPGPSEDDFTIYAHTVNRSCAKPEPFWYHYLNASYRIIDSK